MYTIKPINDSSIPIDLPNCMYSMKNIYRQSNFPDLDIAGSAASNQQKISSINLADKTTSGNDAMDSLELRQESILKQLKELKNRLTSMHKDLGICAKPGPAVSKKQTTSKKIDSNNVAAVEQKPIDVALLHDIVINANQKNIPYSLIALKKLWKNRLNLITTSYSHSTVAQLSAEAAKFGKLFDQNDDFTDAAIPSINVSLIWKNINYTELIGATAAVRIVGEVNILRYLIRIGPNEFNYESNLDVPTANDIDSTLDLCHQLNNLTVQKDKKSVLRTLNSHLGKSDNVKDNLALTMRNVAVNSALKQLAKVDELLGEFKSLKIVSQIVY